MQSFKFLFTARKPTVMLLGAHCDDIEIGCGGTVALLARRLPHARFVWVTLSADDERERETRVAAQHLLEGVDETEILVERFPGSYFPHCGRELKDYVEALKRFEPDLVLTHCRHDLHQDHRITNELAWNTFRRHAILEYEIPKFDGDLGAPNAFVPLTSTAMDQKCELLMRCFPSQHSRTWFTPETFRGLARIRGIECNAPGGYAEAFYARKMRLEF